MTSRESLRPLIKLARRLQTDPRYMSYVLVIYKQQEGLDDEGLAQLLGTLPELILRLSLCKRPAPLSSTFAEQIRELADYTLTDEAQLASILRQVDSLERLNQRPVSPISAEDDAQQQHALAGLLAAARDRDETGDEEVKSADDRQDINQSANDLKSEE
jgi:hypothetical protein